MYTFFIQVFEVGCVLTLTAQLSVEQMRFRGSGATGVAGALADSAAVIPEWSVCHILPPQRLSSQFLKATGSFFFFQERRGDSVSGVLVPHPQALAQAACTLRSGFWTGVPATTSFDKSVLLLKKKKSLKPSGLSQNPQLEVIHLECLDLEAHIHFK